MARQPTGSWTNRFTYDAGRRLSTVASPAGTFTCSYWDSQPSTPVKKLDSTIAPKLFIHQRCARLIETLPALQHDPHRSEDVLKVDADEEGVGGDDAADCLRYLMATKGGQ